MFLGRPPPTSICKGGRNIPRLDSGGYFRGRLLLELQISLKKIASLSILNGFEISIHLWIGNDIIIYIIQFYNNSGHLEFPRKHATILDFVMHMKEEHIFLRRVQNTQNPRWRHVFVEIQGGRYFCKMVDPMYHYRSIDM